MQTNKYQEVIEQLNKAKANLADIEATSDIVEGLKISLVIDSITYSLEWLES